MPALGVHVKCVLPPPVRTGQPPDLGDPPVLVHVRMVGAVVVRQRRYRRGLQGGLRILAGQNGPDARALPLVGPAQLREPRP